MPTHFSLFKKHKIYYIQYTDSSGIRRQKSTRKKTKVEALAFLRLFDSQGSQDRIKVEGKTLVQFAEEYREYSRGVFSEGTQYLHGLALKELVEVAGNIPIHKITSNHLDLLKARLMRRVSPPTVNERLSKMKAVLKTAGPVEADSI